MRNLKKLISLLLVVAMIASLCVVGMFSAAAADEEVSSYTMPAKVITGIEVIKGYPDGTYRYEEPVKRSEAAAIIARLMLGKTTAASLEKTVTETQFTDVPDWASGYIAYLVKSGVVNGKSETTFDPNGNVTGIEFAKMLLCALGYGKQGEYVGAGWDIATLVDANALGIFSGAYTAADLTKAATREECMLYAYNVLFKYVVNYNNNLNTYERATTTQLNKTNYVTLGSKYGFSIESTDANGDRLHDEYGRPVTVFNYGPYFDYFQTVVVDEPIINDRNGVNSDLLYATYGKESAAILSGQLCDVWIDGVLHRGQVTISKIYNTELGVNNLQIYVDETDSNGNKTGKKIILSDVGATIEVYGDYGDYLEREYIRGDYTDIKTLYGADASFVIYYEKGDMVSSVKTDKNGDTVYTLANGKQIVDNDLKASRGDYIIYTEGYRADYGKGYSYADPIAVQVAEKLTGSVTAYRALTNSLVINGKAYGISHSNKEDILARLTKDGTVIPGVYTFMLDSYGNVLDIDMVDELYGNYLYVTNVSAREVKGGQNYFDAMTGGLVINVVYTDGSGTGALQFQPIYDTETKTYYADVLGEPVYLVGTDDEIRTKVLNVMSKYSNGWFSYYINRYGYVSLYAPDANLEYADYYNYGTVPTVTRDRSVFDPYYSNYIPMNKRYIADSSTVQVIVDSRGHVSKRTGYTRFQDVQGHALFTYSRVGMTFDTIYIFMQNATETVVDSYSYLLYPVETRTYDADYLFLTTDGEQKTVTIDNDLLPAGGLIPTRFYDLSYSSGRLINVSASDITKLSTYHEEYVMRAYDRPYAVTNNSPVILDADNNPVMVPAGLYTWYNAAEFAHGYTSVPAGYCTIGRAESTYFVTESQDYDYYGDNGSVDVYTISSMLYVLDPSCKIVDTTGHGYKTLTEGMGVISQLDPATRNAKIVWIMYAPAE